MMIQSVPQLKTKQGECEVCTHEGTKFLTLRVSNGKVIWFCDDCWTKEVETRKGINETIETAKKIDDRVTVRTDLFNNATVSIIELKQSIEDDASITNKPYELAKILKERFQKYQQVIFEKNQEIIQATNNQKAIQVYMNNLANSLRAEEREKLRISDINYQPAAVKPTVKKVSVKNKVSKLELRNAAKELGVSEFLIQAVITSKGCSIQEAIISIRDMAAQNKK